MQNSSSNPNSPSRSDRPESPGQLSLRERQSRIEDLCQTTAERQDRIEGVLLQLNSRHESMEGLLSQLLQNSRLALETPYVEPGIRGGGALGLGTGIVTVNRGSNPDEYRSTVAPDRAAVDIQAATSLLDLAQSGCPFPLSTVSNKESSDPVRSKFRMSTDTDSLY